MTSRLRVALFVEGSESPPLPRGVRSLESIWNEHLPGALGLEAFSSVVPIPRSTSLPWIPTIRP